MVDERDDLNGSWDSSLDRESTDVPEGRSAESGERSLDSQPTVTPGETPPDLRGSDLTLQHLLDFVICCCYG